MTPRVGYAHHGIYVGDGQVVHYAGRANDFKSGPIELVSLEVFAQGRGFAICKHIAPDPPETIIARAREKLGENANCVFSNNCEHSCNCVRDGEYCDSNRVVGIGLIVWEIRKLGYERY